MSTLSSGIQAHSGLGSSISMPTPVHLGRWQEEEENEDDQEINSGSTPKQGTAGSSCWSALFHKVYLLTQTHVYDLCFVALYFVTNITNGLLSYKGFIAMIISPLSLFFFSSVYILLSSMNIVALDDPHGEFSMDL